ncbi:MAG TPA: radical SAM protein, partial [Candidatus Gracilibacteria bacterium]|nr:radical SAM protein [Candidatus Gracilibacteria bacterium]
TEDLYRIFYELAEQKVNNIDLVSPTIWAASLIPLLKRLKNEKFPLPLVWNSNAYESVALIKSLAGLIDIYLPDFKYGEEELGQLYSKVPEYPQIAVKAIQTMYQQVGNLEIDSGLARRGIIVRHLILPNHLENSYQVLKQISQIDPEIYLSIMSQYQVTGQSLNYPQLNRPLRQKELDSVLAYQKELGLTQGWYQEIDHQNHLLPDFGKENPFGK